MATIKDLAEQYGLEDYKQLLGGYPNATKFANALQSNIESHIPTTEDLQSPERMGEWSLAAALNQPTGLTFIGKNARNWDAQAAKLAEEKLNAGADPAEVWREHLIGRMPDKTLFSEISDKDASFKGAGSFGDVVMNRLRALQNAGKKTVDDTMNVADIFKHRDLAESYPELFPSTEVQFLPKDTTLKGSMQVMDDGTNILKMPYDAPHNKNSTMLHELQHAIQKDEGWGQGGSPQEFTRQKEAEHARDVLNWRNEVLARKKKYPDTDTNAIENSIIKDYSDMGLFNDFVPSREARELATQPYMMYPERYDHTNEFERLNNLVGEYGLDKRTTPYTPIEGYKRLAGEAQARATQDRLNMDMAQRRENYPLAGGKLSDIPLEDLIYKYEGNGPSLDVHGYGTAKKIADVLNTKYGKDIDADISGNDRGLTLNKLIVDADKRNQGIGSNFLKDLTQYADEESLPMQLTAAGDFGGKKARQVSLYKKYGFLENKGKNRDYSISENMYRTPNDLSELSKYKDYVGEHSAPLGDSGAPLHDLTANNNSVYPSDVYSSQANQYYGSGEPEDAQLFAMAQRLKDKPNEKVSIYRAVPKMQSNSEKAAQLEKDLANYMKRGRMPSNSDFNNKSDWYEWASNERDRLASLPEETLDPLSINHGDWVALDKKYAKEHGESALGGNYKILSKKVPARQLFTNGDSIREWGWDSRYAQGGSVDKDSLQLNKPRRTPSHPDKSHIVKTMVDGKEKIIRFGEQGAETAGKPKEGESERMTAKRESFKARHAKNIAKGPSSAAYWANKVKWAEGGEVDIMSKLDELAGGGDYLADLEQLKIAYPNATKFFNATQSALEEAVPTTEQMRDPDYLIEHLNPMALSMSAPEKTVNAYKLFRTKANDPDTLYPLFVNADKPVLKDEWIPAEAGAPASQNSDKVKSLLGPLAYRPGWHAGDVPVATHIGKGGKPPVYRPSEHTWAEVEFPDDIDWQTLANERGMNKKGVIVPKFAHITDQLPEGGFYRYKTSPNMTGQWLIGGSMKLGKHLSDDEVKAINEASGLGVEDLPRFHEYLSRNADNPSELSRVINSSAGKDEYFQMLKNARDNEIDDLLKRYSEFTDDKALSAMDKRYNKYLKKGYAEGGEVKDLHNKYEESDYGYGNRPDKTKKGLGYFGELERPDGTGVMTEYSIGVPIHGEEMDVPTLVPTLTPDEIRLILHMQDGDDMPRSIVHKAIDHAHQRLSEGKPIFATEEDLYAHGGIVDVLHNDAIEQIMKAFMDSMADDEELSAPAVSIEITTQNTETPRRGKIPKSIAREAKHG